MMPPKIKVVHIITKLELGGAQANTLYTLRHLNRNRYEPFLITGKGGILDEEARSISDLKYFFIPYLIREINPLQDILALFSIYRILKFIKPQVVHTHSSKAGILGRWAAWMAGIPVTIHTFHGYGFNDCQSWLKRNIFILAEKLTSRITSHFIAVSGENIHKGLRLTLFNEEQVTLIRSGIDVEVFKNTEIDTGKKKREIGLPPRSKVIGMIACMKPQKAPLDFVEVARLVHKELPDVYFLYVGDGELRFQIEDAVNKYSLNERFKLTGWRTDIPEIMRILDVLVLTSRWEGLPRVLPEAMAAGIPIVATPVDGTLEAVVDGVNGFLVPPGDIKVFKDRIMFLLKNVEKAQEMGAHGTKMVEEFNIKSMTPKQEELYESLLSISHRSQVSGERQFY